MAFNALAYARDLENAGVSQKQATAQAQALHQAFEDQKSELATKGDLSALRADFADLRNEIGELRVEVRTEVGALRQEIGQLDSKLTSHMALLETRLTRWMLIAAGFGGGIAGGLAILAKFIKQYFGQF